MQTTENPKMDWQIEPAKKLVTNDPVRIDSKFELEKKDTTRIPLWKLLQKIIQNPPYQDYRYSCVYCGSLDVFITVNEDTGTIHISCLDCNKIWFEDKLVNLEVTKQCLC
jgi:hypothetical protein